MMKFLIVISCLIAVQAGVVKKQCVTIEGHSYEKELLVKDFDRPYLLDVNKATNDLYFSYSLNEDDSKSVRLNLKTKEYYKIEDIKNGNAHAVDQSTGDVYIGAYNSIYKYKPVTAPIKIINNLENNWAGDMFVKDGKLFYVTYPEEKFYLYKKGDINNWEIIMDLSLYDDFKVNYFVVDNRNELIFANSTGIYRSNSNRTVLLKGTGKDDVRGLTVDNSGKVYACLVDGLYVLEEATNTMTKVLDAPLTFGLAFDRDNNMIYANENEIVRFLPINKSEC